MNSQRNNRTLLYKICGIAGQLSLAGLMSCATTGSGGYGSNSLMGGMGGLLNVPQQPKRQDTYAGMGMGSAPAAFPQLTLALLFSENTKNAIDYGYKGAAWGGFDPRRPQVMEKAMYQRHFKTVVNIDKAADARGINADVIALVDNFVEAGRVTKADYRTVFLTLDNEKIDEITAHAEKSMGWNAGKAVEELVDEALRQLEASMRASLPMREFAKSRTGSAPAAKAAPAPVPQVKTIQSDVDRPGYGLPEDERNFALVVGIEKYENLPVAEFAERDAASVKKHLLALGYPERNIIYITGSKAGRAGIEKYVESWLPRNVGPESRVFVYFSGHGAPDVESGSAYLVPWDGDVKFLSNTGYPVKKLYEKLNSLKAQQVLVALDACFSGAGGRSVLAKGTRPLVTKVDMGMAQEGKVVVLAASAADEITGTDENEGHGLFTYYLLKGLNARSGDITVKGLHDFITPKVQDAARRDNRDQTPQLLPQGLGVKGDLKMR